MSWTAAQIGELRRLWAEGYSASAIACRLGVSRNAAIGKIHRLELPEPQTKLARVLKSIADAKAIAAAVASKKRSPRQPPVKRPVPLPLPVVPCRKSADPASGQMLVTLEHRRRNRCCWPVNEGSPYLYCGAPCASGAAYCGHHAARRVSHRALKPLSTPYDTTNLGKAVL